RKKKNLRIRLSSFAQRRQNVLAVLLNRETLQFRVGFAFVIAVNLGRVVARSHAGAADVEPHLRRMKELVKQTLARGRRELVERIAGGIGKCRAETKNRLELFLRVENDCLFGRLGCRGPPPQPTRAGKAIFLALPLRCPSRTWATLEPLR